MLLLPLLLACAPDSERSGGAIQPAARVVRPDGSGVEVAIAAWGRDALRPYAPTRGCDRFARCRSDGALEEGWSTRRGVWEHAWVALAAPSGVGPLRFLVPVDGAVEVRGDEARLRTPTGTWTYTSPRAWDADGRPLPLWMEAGPEGLEVVVDDAGAAWPVFVDPLVTTALRSWPGEDATSRFGRALASPGDVDGDGLPDVLAGGWGHDGYRGRVYLFPGAAGGPAETASRAWDGPDAESAFGFTLAALDVTGDGLLDLAVGAPVSGAVHVFANDGAGPAASPLVSLRDDDPDDLFGWSVARVGDVDGDGDEELAVGAPGVRERTGQVQVFGGDPDGPAGAGQTINGAYADDRLGTSVAGAGDVNGDGYLDLVAGAPGATFAAGEVWLVLGGARGIEGSAAAVIPGGEAADAFGHAVAGAGDVDADGFADVVVGAPGVAEGAGRVYLLRGGAGGLDATGAATLEGARGDQLGWTVAGVGDVDGDGFDEVLVGAPGADGDAGAALLWSGTATGMPAVPSPGVGGEAPDGAFGVGLAGGPDLDGDGYGDAVVGADTYDGGVGRAYLFQGFRDGDGDGAAVEVDCDDADPGRAPGLGEIPLDGIDQDCDGYDTCWADADNDGWRAAGDVLVVTTDADCTDSGEHDGTGGEGDCDDADPATNPGARELVADGKDQTCDGAELCYADEDGDGARTEVIVRSPDADCADAGEALATAPAIDCVDTDPTVYPGAAEVIDDGIDQDCEAGDACWTELDGDGYRGDRTAPSEDLDCADAGEADGSVPTGDCDDDDPASYPGADEVIGDEKDQSCDGAEVCLVDGDGDGWHPDDGDTVRSTDVDCDDAGEAALDRGGDCDDADPTRSPGAEEGIADGVDQDCDGGEHCYRDADGDGWRADEGFVESEDMDCTDATEAGADVPAGDCADARAQVNPGADEVPGNGADEDCDGSDGKAGCGCATEPSGAGAAGLLAVLALVARRRRR